MMLTPPKRRKELVAYFILAYAISWAVEIPIALSLRGLIDTQIPLGVHYLASFGPFIAALIVVGMVEGWPGVRRLFSGMAKWRVGSSYWLFAVGMPVGLFALALIFARLIQGAWPDLRLLNEMGVSIIFMLISVLAASVTITWLYNGTGGSLLLVVIFHALFDFFSVSEAAADFGAVVMSAVIVFWAVRVTNVYGRENLALRRKVVM